MIKKAFVALLCTFGFSLVLSAGEDVSSQKADNHSFNQLLKNVNDKYYASSIPAPVYTPVQTPIKEDRYWVTIYAANKYDRTKLLELGMDIVEFRPDKVSGIMHEPALRSLPSKGYIIESRMPLSTFAAYMYRDFPPADSAYHNYKETNDLLGALAGSNPDMVSVFSIGKSYEGRDIMALRINAAARRGEPSSKPGALYMGNHHAREHLSNEVPLLFAAWLLDNRKDPEVKKYLDTLDVFIVPMVNPDGVEYDIRTGRYQWHRKNMRVNSDKSIGVDLNRNYDSVWCSGGASTYPGADTYCGAKAFSEPESQAVKGLVEAHPNIKTLMSYHSYGQMILYPWGGKDEPVANEKDRNAFIKISEQMGKLTGYRAMQSNELYIATGDTCDWAYEKAGIFAFTAELEGPGFYPPAANIDKAVKNNIKAAFYMLTMTGDPYR